MKEIRFGIVGTGNIAGKFARALALSRGASLAAACSRDVSRARGFLEQHADACAAEPAAFDGVREMAASGMIDVAYIATPHPMHFEGCMAALEGGAAVLCEKPMSMTRREAETLFAEAERRGLYLAEGMWTRFLPVSRTAKAWIDAGRIGRVRFIDGMFSCGMGERPVPRLVERELGGGALYDIGVYCVEMAAFYAGAEPEDWASAVTPLCAGVDLLTAVCARFPGGALMTMRAGIDCDAPANMTVYGDRGRIELPRFFSAPEARLYEGGVLTDSARADDCELPRGFVPQIEATADAIRRGLTRSPVVPPETTIAAAGLMEDVLRRIQS